MMVPRRVVVVLEAEKLLIPKRESKATEEDQERLTEFIKAPAPHSTVVFVCGALDKRRTLVKLLAQGSAGRGLRHHRERRRTPSAG